MDAVDGAESVAVFDERACYLGEGPYFDEYAGRAYWVDILAGRVLWRDTEGDDAGELRLPIVDDQQTHIGAAVPRARGGLVLCLPAGPVLLDPDGAWRLVATFAEADAAAGVRADPLGPLRANDAKADPAGRLWLGSMAYDERPGAGALYRLDGGELTRMLGGTTVSNGLGWSPDGSTMYHIDSPTRNITAFAYDLAKGELGESRVFARIDDGLPDGLCVDAEGYVWVSLWQGSAVRRYAPDGSLERVVRMPTQLVTSCAFVGAGLDTLLITTAALGGADPAAGLTYAHRPPGITGRPVDRFAG